MVKQLIFIDDSGDPGFKSDSSTNFVMAAALFIDQKEAALLSREISEFRKNLGWREDYEFKFSKIRKDIIKNLLHKIIDYDFKIYAVFVNKKDFNNFYHLVDNEKLYNWTIKELLSIIPISNAKIEIDGRASKQYMKNTATYLRNAVNRDKKLDIKIKFEDSARDNLIQLADLIAGSINRSMSKDKTDAKTYIKIIKPKIVKIKRLL